MVFGGLKTLGLSEGGGGGGGGDGVWHMTLLDYLCIRFCVVLARDCNDRGASSASL